MKEIIPEIKAQDKVEIVAQQQQKKEVKLLGSQRKIPGLILWEYNLNTQTLSIATFIKQNLEYKGENNLPEIRNRVNIKEGCVYFQALNKKNAIKKLRAKKIN